MLALAETGSGNFYVLEDPAAVREVFTEEVSTFLVPVAESVTLEVDVGAGYVLRRVHGTRLWTLKEGGARIEIPSLFVAGRTSPDDAVLGRRGGGGAILVELMPTANSASVPAGVVGTLSLSWTDPQSDEVRDTTAEVSSPLAPGVIPESGHFDSASVEKAFVMLNLFMGFEMAAQRSADGALSDALRVLNALAPRVDTWLDTTPDLDIQSDLDLLRRFANNLNAAGASQPPPSAMPEPWPVD
jgi:Ca-activated chloride channel family protein